ncbi:phage BR0599 family protein [Wolbachia endosymbiont of Wuchereria bancrofti]|uniref:phage BR0599 family protein n=1 Tax=Wolbachia endosymbiont of Wuchereria bancrofti TaxID=96496 RepID=UPI001FE94E73|nr:phage BR0599 family protein [Wolbachia endosymbiont of Wuchereria bancrofti]
MEDSQQSLRGNIAKLYSLMCRTQFCDSSCEADARRFSRVSTITKVIDEKRFEDTSLTENSGCYKHRIVKFFGSAAYTAFEGAIKEYRNKVVTLFALPTYQIFADDKCSILTDCDKTFSTCKSRFNNAVNFSW